MLLIGCAEPSTIDSINVRHGNEYIVEKQLIKFFYWKISLNSI